MDRTYWHKQTADKPLFPDLLWSRPENRAQAGKLLIVGGNAHGFAAPAEAFSEALKAGLGSARVILPDSLAKTVGKLFPAAEFAPSTPSGSFASQALAVLLDAAVWADGVLLAGDFGRNAETAGLIEQFNLKYTGQITLAGDATEISVLSPEALGREKTLLVLNFPQLQKIAIAAKFTTAFTSKMDFLHLIDALHEFTEKFPASVVLPHLDTTFVAVNGKVSTTKPAKYNEVQLAAYAATWWLQNTSKPFEAITSSLL